MDIKTLSTIIGHVSSSTTLDIYTHTTDSMQQKAAASIDRGIGKNEPQDGAQAADSTAKASGMTDFKPYKGTRRKPGAGCVTRISEHLWEGRYSPVWPDGRKHSRNVYAHTREECEEKLAELIVQMKAEIQAIKQGGNTAIIPKGGSEKKDRIAAYMRDHPEVTNKSEIAKAARVDRSTVRRHYDEIRKEQGTTK